MPHVTGTRHRRQPRPVARARLPMRSRTRPDEGRSAVSASRVRRAAFSSAVSSCATASIAGT